MGEPVFILNFHGLGPMPPGLSVGEADCWIDQPFFEEILDSVRGRQIEITFDDSNESDFEVAFSALRARGMSAKFFVVAGRLDQRGYLSTEQLKSLAAAGMGIGSHGMRHRRWAGLSVADLHEELVGAKERIEQIVSMPIREAACPFGIYNRRVLGSLRRAGYEGVYTSDEGPASKVGWVQSRNTIRRSHNLAHVQTLISRRISPLSSLLRGIKLKLKQLR